MEPLKASINAAQRFRESIENKEENHMTNTELTKIREDRKLSKKEHIQLSPCLHLPMGFQMTFLVPEHILYLMSFLGGGVSL